MAICACYPHQNKQPNLTWPIIPVVESLIYISHTVYCKLEAACDTGTETRWIMTFHTEKIEMNQSNASWSVHPCQISFPISLFSPGKNPAKHIYIPVQSQPVFVSASLFLSTLSLSLSLSLSHTLSICALFNCLKHEHQKCTSKTVLFSQKKEHNLWHWVWRSEERRVGKECRL